MSTTKLLLHMDGDASSEIGGNDGYTKLLCHMDTSPFLDDSYSMHSITNNGVSVNTSIKKFGGGSGYFDGSSYLEMADSNDWDFSDGDFTIDFWVRFDSLSGTQGFCGRTVDSTHYWEFRIDNTSGAYFYDYNGSPNITCSQGGLSGWSTDTWYHIALVRNGNNFNIYRDGVNIASSTSSNSLTNYNTDLEIGKCQGGVNDFTLNGNIDELRISKGIARWTSNFTPPTTYYGGHRLIPSGGPKLDGSVKKFGSASMYFDGTDDYVKINNHNDWDLLSEDFTIDCWVKHTDHSSTESYVGLKEDGNNNWHFGHVDGTGLQFKFKRGGSDIVSISASSGEITDTDWHHAAVVKNGNDYKLFMDGVMVGSVTDSSTDTLSGDLTIGAKGGDSGQLFNGYIDELRISKGIARWTSNFTPPTEEYETDEYTKLLLHFSGDMSDSNHTINFPDSSRIDVSPTKWNGSFFFNGADDRLIIADSNDWSFGPDNFTIDVWIRLLSKSASPMVWVAQYADADNRWYLGLHDSVGAQFYAEDSGTEVVNCYQGSGGTDTWNIGQWYHVALVRNGTSFKIYRDGSEIASATGSGDMPNLSADLSVGGRTSSWYFHGYIDELRIVNGEAIWTSDFTAPSEPYTIYELTGDLSDSMRLLSISEAGWNLVGNEEVTGDSYRLTYTTNDSVTIIGRKSDGESQGYGNIIPQ